MGGLDGEVAVGVLLLVEDVFVGEDGVVGEDAGVVFVAVTGGVGFAHRPLVELADVGQGDLLLLEGAAGQGLFAGADDAHLYGVGD